MIFMILYLIILNIGTDFTLKTAQSSLASWITFQSLIIFTS